MVTAPDPAPRPAPSAEGRQTFDEMVDRLYFELKLRSCGYMGRDGAAEILAECLAGPQSTERPALLAMVMGRLATGGLGRMPGFKFCVGCGVRKTKGSSWHGRVVGFYSTALTPIGYAVESEREPGSVQIYPESALEAWSGRR